jgi:hypothetical protein
MYACSDLGEKRLPGIERLSDSGRFELKGERIREIGCTAWIGFQLLKAALNTQID